METPLLSRTAQQLPQPLHAMDLRSAIQLALPEFRALHIETGAAGVERELPPGSERTFLPYVTERGFRAVPTGSYPALPNLVAERGELQLVRVSHAAYRSQVQLTDEVLPLAFASQSPIGSATFSAALPPAAPDTRDFFFLELTYQAKPKRAAFLITQAQDALLKSGWKKLSPQKVRSPQHGGIIELRPLGEGRVRVRYHQPL